MVRRKLPPTLNILSFQAWLKSVENDTGQLFITPPAFLVHALNNTACLREATIIKIVEVALKKGVGSIELTCELFNPTLLQKLIAALTTHASQIIRISLSLQCLQLRTVPGPVTSHLVTAFKGMTSLTKLQLIGAATDNLLKVLKEAGPPLHTLDISESVLVTDKGICSLIGLEYDVKVNGNLYSMSPLLKTLYLMNIWGTSVTTRGCVLVLRCCLNLHSLTCQWTAEALTLLYLHEFHKPLNLLHVFAEGTALNSELEYALSTLCGKLTKLVIRKSQDSLNTIKLISRIPHITELSLIQCDLISDRGTIFLSNNSLTYLHLIPVTATVICLSTLFSQCPLLSKVIIEGVIPTFNKNFNEEKSLITMLSEFHLKTHQSEDSLSPELIIWIIKCSNLLQILDLGSCDRLEDEHYLSFFADGNLRMLSDLRLSHATRLSDTAIKAIIEDSPQLQRIILKMLSRERLELIDQLKEDFRIQNIDLQLITFGCRG